MIRVYVFHEIVGGIYYVAEKPKLKKSKFDIIFKAYNETILDHL